MNTCIYLKYARIMAADRIAALTYGRDPRRCNSTSSMQCMPKSRKAEAHFPHFLLQDTQTRCLIHKQQLLVTTNATSIRNRRWHTLRSDNFMTVGDKVAANASDYAHVSICIVSFHLSFLPAETRQWAREQRWNRANLQFSFEMPLA